MIEPASPALMGGFFTTVPPGKPKCILTHISGIQKYITDDPTCRTAKETRIFWTWWGKQAGMIQENSIETYTFPYVKQIANGV